MTLALQGAADLIVAGQADLDILVLSDSTANDTSDWVRIWATRLGVMYPAHSITYESWNHSTQLWNTPEVVVAGSGQATITIWNAAGSGYGIPTYTAQPAELIGYASRVDQVIIALGHQANSRTVPLFEELIDLTKTYWPDAVYTLIQQNPWLTSDPWAAGVWQVVQDVADSYGIGTIDVFQAFTDLGDFSTYMADNTHPNADPGMVLWRDTVEVAWLAAGTTDVSLLGRAELLLQAKNYTGSGAWPDETGNLHNATVTGPVFLPHDGTQYLWMTGTPASSNFSTVAYYSAMNVAGDLDLRVELAPDTWQPSVAVGLIDRLGSTGDPNRSYRFTINAATGGILSFAWCPTGSFASYTIVNATAATGFVAGSRHWVRVTMDWDNGSGGYDVTFYGSTDNENWTQIGDVVTGGAPTSQAATVATALLGAQGASNQIAGKLYRAQIYDGVDGTLVMDADFTDTSKLYEPFATFKEKSVNDATVTISRSTTGYPVTVVDRPMFVFDGSDDYMEIADHADLDFGTTDAFTLMIARRPVLATPGIQNLVGKRADLGTGAGYILYEATSGTVNQISIGDGTININDQYGRAYARNVADVLVGVRNVTDDDIEMFVDGVGTGSPTTDTTTATLANALSFFVGRGGTVQRYMSGQVFAVALWREALTDTEIAVIEEALFGTPPLSAQAVAQNMCALKSLDNTLDFNGSLKLLSGTTLDAVGALRSMGATKRELVGCINELAGTNHRELDEAMRSWYLSGNF